MADPDEDRPSDAELRDELPADLDVAGFAGAYGFPDNSRRRIPGALYLFGGLLCVALWVLRRGDDPVLVNDGVLVGGLALIAVAAYCFLAGRPQALDEKEALVVATRTAGFAVGHASAQLGWRGLASRPTWRILCYSSEEPPLRRAFVMVDAIDGSVVTQILEDNPEDWSHMA